MKKTTRLLATSILIMSTSAIAETSHVNSNNTFDRFIAKATIDSDNDGIADEKDLDDDNDGILDELECPTKIVDTVTDLDVHGDAKEVNGVVTLTPDSTGKKGSFNAKDNLKLDLSKDFKLSFDLYFGSKDGADGIAFVLHNDSRGASASGSSGGDFGLGGRHGNAAVKPGIAVEFDTHNNLETVYGVNYYDARSKKDHMQFRSLGGNFTATLAAANGLTPPVDLGDSSGVNQGDIEDGNYHSVTVVWNATSKTFVVSFDVGATNMRTLQYTMSNVAAAFGGTTEVYWGFSAATGDKSNEHRIKNISLGDKKICTLDTDGDGTLDKFDNDSDNDGCYDALEGGAALTASNLTNNNSLCEAATCVDTDGVPNLASGGQAVNQSTTAGKVTVVTAPSTQTVTSSPSNVTFTASLSGLKTEVFNSGTPDYSAGSSETVNYQWQESTDNGNTWQDIAGENSPSLTVSNVDTSMHTNLYRVAGSCSSNTCLAFSPSAGFKASGTSPIIPTKSVPALSLLGLFTMFTSIIGGAFWLSRSNGSCTLSRKKM